MKTVLVLAANPIESVRVQFQKELSEIQEAWKRSKAKDGFEVKFEPAATWDRWRRGLLDYEPEVVHFIGHGGVVKGDGVKGIVLEGPEVVSGERLAQLLLEFPTVRCVVLNSCHSKVQATEIFERVGHVGCAIGMKQSIKQESARQFAIAFYDSVFSGQDYGASFRIGKTAIQSRHDAFKPHFSSRKVDVEEPIRQPVLLSPEQLEKQELQKEYEKLQRKYQLISEQISGELNEDNQDTLCTRRDSIKRKMNDIFKRI